MQVHGELKRAQLELLAADPSGAANLVLGRILQNTTDGRVKVADGTKTKEFLLNDDKINVGTSVTLADNVRIHRAGVALLQFVTANDSTAEGSLSTNTAKLSFQFESYTTAGRPANGKVGRIIFDTDLNVLLVDDGTNWVSTANGTEISECAINLGTASNTNYLKVSSDTKANLEALTRKQGAIYYATDEDKYYGDDGLNLVELGSGGAGGINYVSNPDAESNADGHVAYKDAAQEVPEDGVGGSPTLAVSRSTVSPLVGNASFVIAKPASNTQGEGVKVANEDFDEADKGKIQIMSFEYDASDVNYNDGDFRVYFRDETNGVIYRVNGEDIKGGKGTHYARVQVPIDCNNGSLIIHCAATHTDAISFKYDRVSMGPQKIANGTIITDWKTANSVGDSWSGTAVSARYRRVGDSAEIEYFIDITGGGQAGTLAVDLPDGLSIDSSSLLDGSEVMCYGIGNAFNGSSLFHLRAYGAGTSINFRAASAGSTFTAHADVTPTVPFAWSIGDSLYAKVVVPISGWSSQSQLSEDFGGRDILFDGTSNNGSAFTAFVTDINFISTQDTAAAWDGTGFTAPEKGVYDFEGMTRISVTNNYYVLAYIDGVGSKYIMSELEVTAQYKKFAASIPLEKGQRVSLRLSTSANLTPDNAHRITISKRSSSQQILETEIVAARYTSNSGQSFVNNTNLPVTYEDLVYDTHNSYNTSTGVYTVPVTGKYLVATTNRLQGRDVSSIAGRAFTAVQVNGVFRSDMGLDQGGGGGAYPLFELNGVAVIDVVKGDEVRITLNQNVGSTQSLTTNSTSNVFHIVRVK